MSASMERPPFNRVLSNRIGMLKLIIQPDKSMGEKNGHTDSKNLLNLFGWFGHIWLDI